MSQEKQILEYLLAGNTLTPIEALNMFGCFRLGARICDLRQRGYDIINEAKTGSFAIYKMEMVDE